MSLTSSRLSDDKHTKTSVDLVASQICFGVKALNLCSVRSMTKVSSLIVIQAAVSSVNWGLNVNPNLPKKSIDFFRSLTGRLTKIFWAMCSPFLELLTPFSTVRRTRKAPIDTNREIRLRPQERKYRPICWRVLNILAEILKRDTRSSAGGHHVDPSDSREACLACCHDCMGARLHNRRSSPSLCSADNGNARDGVDSRQLRRSMDEMRRRISAGRCRSRSRCARYNRPDRFR